MRTRRFLDVLTVALLATLMIGHGSAFAQGNSNKPPKDDGGTEEPPATDLPPIEYLATFISLPAPTDSGFMLNEFNDSGMAVGWYKTLDGEQRAWLYDPFINGTTAIDLNDMPIVGLDPEWIIRSAVGVNNNGLVVGYVGRKDGTGFRRGYVLDLTTGVIHPLPDEHLAGTYAQSVNDNGDILGVFSGDDGHSYNYLFNPGLRGGVADLGLEIIASDVHPQGVPVGVSSTHLNNPPEGWPSQIVGWVPGAVPGEPGWLDGTIFQYTRGGTVVYRTDFPYFARGGPCINDFGDIAGRMAETIPLRGNKTTTEYYLWRERQGGQLELLMQNSSGLSSMDMNKSGTVLTGGGGTHLYHDDYGYVELAPLITYENLTRGDHMNNVGPLGFGEIAGRSSATDEIFILTPVEVVR